MCCLKDRVSYFTEFGSFRGALHKIVDKALTMTIYDYYVY